MKKLVANAQTPWPQIFLIRNLYHSYGFVPMQKILQEEKWILPRGVEISQVSIFQKPIYRSLNLCHPSIHMYTGLPLQTGLRVYNWLI